MKWYKKVGMAGLAALTMGLSGCDKNKSDCVEYIYKSNSESENNENLHWGLSMRRKSNGFVLWLRSDPENEVWSETNNVYFSLTFNDNPKSCEEIKYAKIKLSIFLEKDKFIDIKDNNYVYGSGKFNVSEISAGRRIDKNITIDEICFSEKKSISIRQCNPEEIKIANNLINQYAKINLLSAAERRWLEYGCKERNITQKDIFKDLKNYVKID